MRTSQKTAGIITTIGIDLGKNTFHLVGFDQRGAIVLQQKAMSEATVENNLPAKTPIGERVTTEFREFVILTAYLYVCFTAFSYLKASILHDQGIAYAPWAIAAVKSVIAAKFVLIGRALGIGDRYMSYPLIVPTLFKSFAFLALLIAMMVVEEAVVGFFHGRTFSESMANIGGGTLDQRIATSIVVLLIFMPYFAFRTLGEAIGERSLVRLFFDRRRNRDDA